MLYNSIYYYTFHISVDKPSWHSSSCSSSSRSGVIIRSVISIIIDNIHIYIYIQIFRLPRTNRCVAGPDEINAK